jgi:apolipoprotein N-acyltransferase
VKVLSSISSRLPALSNVALAVLSAILLVLAFPGFEFWFLAWFALAPLLYAIEREKKSNVSGFILGWVFGTMFFAGTCWWLTYAPINYGGLPAVLAYLLLFVITAVVGLFPALFSLILAAALRRFGPRAILLAPFIWIATEFLRFWITGNNWNAVAYSQAFHPWFILYARIGGIYLVGFMLIFFQSVLVYLFINDSTWLQSNKYAARYLFLLHSLFGHWMFLSKSVRTTIKEVDSKRTLTQTDALFYVLLIFPMLAVPQLVFSLFTIPQPANTQPNIDNAAASVIALQPNVPMSGLGYQEWKHLRDRHVEIAETALQTARNTNSGGAQTIIIFPESPMNFTYGRDREFQQFLREFTARNNASVLFNSAEPDLDSDSYYNSAVMVDPSGKKIAEYDKIFLLPFGEYAPVPAPLQRFVPTMVGNFSFGKNYNLIPFGDAKAGIMICFESHFPNLSREYAREGADVLVELTNDGYLGNTPVLRQHLANAVFRAVETNRPVLRVTNVGIAAYINELGQVIDASDPYTESTRVWTVSKSGGDQTFYVRYGDWFAWLCTAVSAILLLLCIRRRRASPVSAAQ